MSWGRGNVKPDPLKAREWYTKAAQAGHAGAAFYLAKILETSGDKEEAKPLYAKAALAGDPIASACFGIIIILIWKILKNMISSRLIYLPKNLYSKECLINAGGVRLGNAIKDLNPGGEAPSPNSEYEHERQSIEQHHRLFSLTIC